MLNQRFHVAISRAKALETLYRPVLEAGQAELQKTKSGSELLAGAQAFAKEFGEITSSRTIPRKRDSLHNLNTFRQLHGEQLRATHAQLAKFQPSSAQIARILYPEIPVTRWLFQKRAILGGTLLQAKATGQDVDTATQGLGDPPPLVQSCITPPYDKQETHQTQMGISDFSPGGTATLDGNTMAAGDIQSNIFVPTGVYLESAFVGHDFAVPPGPTQYTTTISYDWSCSGEAGVGGGVAIVNVDLAIVIDKRDGTRETYAREISLLTVPAFGGDSFSHQANDVTVTIPFTRDGLNGTVTIWVGVDGQATAIGSSGLAGFSASAFVREICLTSVG